ncbi:MAG: DUF4405 domain-containing protein [Anaerolineales bacterium]|nr:DUF4405 domain-containing protein [Anaerolineales bacterium]
MSNISNTKMSQTKRNLLLDIFITTVFLITAAPSLTGLLLHEWISVGLGVVLIVHILLHWKWVVATTGRFFSRLAAQARVNYILNFLLLFSFVSVIGSGVMISQEFVESLGFQATRGGFWEWLHFLSADAILWIVGLHIALHWKWIVNAVSRYLIQPLRGRHTVDTAAVTAMETVKKASL